MRGNGSDGMRGARTDRRRQVASRSRRCRGRPPQPSLNAQLACGWGLCICPPPPPTHTHMPDLPSPALPWPGLACGLPVCVGAVPQTYHSFGTTSRGVSSGLGALGCSGNEASVGQCGRTWYTIFGDYTRTGLFNQVGVLCWDGAWAGASESTHRAWQGRGRTAACLSQVFLAHVCICACNKRARGRLQHASAPVPFACSVGSAGRVGTRPAGVDGAARHRHNHAAVLAAAEDFAVRLAGGPHPSEGRLEVSLKGVWGEPGPARPACRRVHRAGSAA